MSSNVLGMTPSTINAYYTPLNNQVIENYDKKCLQQVIFKLRLPSLLGYCKRPSSAWPDLPASILVGSKCATKKVFTKILISKLVNVVLKIHFIYLGAMGVVMGHELSHAFDDQGRQYDAEGNMVLN